MTVQEVKKRLEALHYRIVHNVFCNKVRNAELEALNIAIESMKEVEQYRTLGTVEELKEAREKQVAKKPNKVNGEAFCMTIDGKADYEITLLCPTCGNTHLAYGFPCKCGQLLNWEEGGTSD